MIEAREAETRQGPETYLAKIHRLTSGLVIAEEGRREIVDKLYGNSIANPGWIEILATKFKSQQDGLVRKAGILGALAENPTLDTLKTVVPDLSPEESERFSALDLRQPADAMSLEDKKLIDELIEKALSTPVS